MSASDTLLTLATTKDFADRLETTVRAKGTTLEFKWGHFLHKAGLAGVVDRVIMMTLARSPEPPADEALAQKTVETSPARQDPQQVLGGAPCRGHIRAGPEGRRPEVIELSTIRRPAEWRLGCRGSSSH